MTKSIPRGFAVCIIAAFACTPDLTVPENVVVACAVEGDCPNNFHCTNGGICVPSNRDDLVAPTVLEGAAYAPGPSVKAAGTATLAFTVSEDLLVDPILTFVSGASVYTMTRTARDLTARTYSYAYTPTGDEVEGTWIVSAALLDQAGNANTQTVPSIKLDFTPPSILNGSASLLLTPDRKTNPVIDVTAVTNGTTLKLSIATDETLSIPPDVLLDSSAFIGAMDLPSSTVGTLTLKWAGSLGIPDGEHRIFVHLVDDAGNAADVAITDFTLSVDTVPPAAPLVDSLGAIVLDRTPWGHDADLTQSSRLRGSPGSAEAGVTILAFDVSTIPPCRSDACNFAAQARAAVMTADDGSFLIDFGRYDRAAIFVTAADAAGNIEGRSSTDSDLVGHRVRDARLTALTALNDATSPQNGNHLDAAELFEGLVPSSYVLPLARDKAAVADNVTQLTAGKSSWRKNVEPTVSFSRLLGTALAYLPTSAQLVAFGGSSMNSSNGVVTLYGDTWLRETSDFRVPQGLRPPPAAFPAMAYDVVSDALLYQDGTTSWRWRQNSWEQICNAGSCGDAPTTVTAMTNDPVRRVVVLFNFDGSTSEVWEWNGLAWANVCDSACQAAGPSAGRDIRAAFDPATRETMIFGSTTGDDPMWSWNGVRWLQRCVDPACLATRPTPRMSPALAYDGGRGNVVLFGGFNSGDTSDQATDTYTWDGALWTKKARGAVVPGRRYKTQATYDASRDRVVIFGGLNVGAGARVADTIYEWDGTTWSLVESVATPLGGKGVYDPQSQRVIVVSSGVTYAWDGYVWHATAITNTPEDGAVALPLTGTTRRPTLLNASGTYVLDGTNWSQVCSGLCGLPSTTSLMATDGPSLVAVSNSSSGWTYRWNGASWSVICATCTTVSAQSVTYGGSPGTILSGDQNSVFAKLSGASWSSLAVTGGFDATYVNSPLAYDINRDVQALVPGVSVGRPGGTRGKQSLLELRAGNLGAPPLAASSETPISYPGTFAAYDELRGRIVVISAPSAPAASGVWNSAGATQPAHIFTIGLNGVIDTARATIGAIDLSWSGTGSSQRAGALSTGVRFSVWAVDHWIPVSATASAPGHYTAHIDAAALGNPLTVDAIIIGDARKILVAALPDGVNGTMADFASITTDFVQAVVSYRAN